MRLIEEMSYTILIVNKIRFLNVPFREMPSESHSENSTFMFLSVVQVGILSLAAVNWSKLARIVQVVPFLLIFTN